jgi:hypothetical protein
VYVLQKRIETGTGYPRDFSLEAPQHLA